MKEKCSICGKRALFGTIFKCNNCAQFFCHRHEKEQFIQNNILGGGEYGDSFTYYNYPNGESVNYKTFKCYKCRTGMIPKDMGSKKIFLEDYFMVFSFSSIVVFGILAFLAVFGGSFGLSQETCKALETTCIYYFISVLVSSILLLIIIGLYYRGIFRIKAKK